MLNLEWFMLTDEEIQERQEGILNGTLKSEKKWSTMPPA